MSETSQQVSCAVVGLGHGLEDVYTVLAHPRMRLRAVCDIRQEPFEWLTGTRNLEDAGLDISSSQAHLRMVSAIRASGDMAAVEYVHQFADLLDRDDIQGIVLVVPDPLHEEFTVRALEAGKHVLCTKPMATTMQGALHIARTALQRPAHYMLGFQVSYSNFCKAILDLIADGTIGTPRLARFDYHRQPWRPMHRTKNAPTDGSIVKEGVHWLDLIYRINGERPWTRISGLSGKDLLEDLEFEDNGIVILDYEGGFRAAHTFTYFRKSRIEEDFLLVGDRATVRGSFSELRLETDTAERTIGIDAMRLPDGIHFGYTAMYDEFARMVIDGTEPYSGWRNALENMLTCVAAQTAVAENRTVERSEFTTWDWRAQDQLAGHR